MIPAKDIDGRFPEWFTHWGSDDRPATNRFFKKRRSMEHGTKIRSRLSA